MNPINKEAVSRRIRELRKSKEMTLEEWASLFGSNKSAGYKWENGTVPYRRTLEKMAEISDGSVDWILHGDFTEYVTEFVKQFPEVYNFLKRWEDGNYFSKLAEQLSEKGKAYGDDDAILSELFKDSHNRGFIVSQSDVLEYLKNNKMEIRELNVLPVDDMPEYRFHLLRNINDLFMSKPRLPEFEEFNGQKIHDIKELFKISVDYLYQQERLLKEWNLDIDEEEDERVQAMRMQFTKEMYIQSSLAAEQSLIEMIGGYRWLRDRVAEKYEINIESVRKSRHLPYYEIIKYEPDPNPNLPDNWDEIEKILGQ